MDRCLGTKRDGSPCTVTVEPPQTHCWWHAPENAEQRQRAASKGGKRAGRGRPQAETGAIKALLEDLTERVLAGALPTGPAAVVQDFRDEQADPARQRGQGILDAIARQQDPLVGMLNDAYLASLASPKDAEGAQE